MEWVLTRSLLPDTGLSFPRIDSVCDLSRKLYIPCVSSNLSWFNKLRRNKMYATRPWITLYNLKSTSPHYRGLLNYFKLYAEVCVAKIKVSNDDCYTFQSSHHHKVHWSEYHMVMGSLLVLTCVITMCTSSQSRTRGEIIMHSGRGWGM